LSGAIYIHYEEYYCHTAFKRVNGSGSGRRKLKRTLMSAQFGVGFFGGVCLLLMKTRTSLISCGRSQVNLPAG